MIRNSFGIFVRDAAISRSPNVKRIPLFGYCTAFHRRSVQYPARVQKTEFQPGVLYLSSLFWKNRTTKAEVVVAIAGNKVHAISCTDIDLTTFEPTAPAQHLIMARNRADGIAAR